MAYAIKLKPSAVKVFEKLPKPIQKRIAAKIDDLSENPRPPGVEKLSGEDDFYRIRTGDYLLIYTINDDVLLVLILKIGHRREIYRRMHG